MFSGIGPEIQLPYRITSYNDGRFRKNDGGIDPCKGHAWIKGKSIIRGTQEAYRRYTRGTFYRDSWKVRRGDSMDEQI